MSPRVLFVDHSAELGGAEFSLLTVAKDFRERGRVVLLEEGPFLERLRRAGIDASVLQAPDTIDGVRRNGSVLNGLRAIPDLLASGWRLGRIAREYDALVANSQKSMIVSGLAGVFARRPVVWYLRDLMLPAHFGPLRRWGAALASQTLVSHVIANSEATRNALISNGGPKARTSVVYNGIDEEPFRETSGADVAAVRKELDLPDSGVVGVFSRLAEWKGHHVLLKALRSMPDVTALIVGDALFPQDQRYVARLEARINEWNLSDQVRMPGFRNDVPALMQACDVVLHTSTAPEPFGRVIVEGMLAKRPVIAARGGGANEIITHGETGLLVPPEDTSALRRALRDLIANPDKASSIARRGYQTARSRFSTGRMVSGVRDTIRSVVR
jgi:glycosyltransferase involved in cell wall biosynthesis